MAVDKHENEALSLFRVYQDLPCLPLLRVFTSRKNNACILIVCEKYQQWRLKAYKQNAEQLHLVKNCTTKVRV